MAGPTAVVVMAFPAKFWTSFAVSVVKEILFKGRPCRPSASSGARALPASEAKNVPEGVMHGDMPKGAVSLNMSTFWETSQMRVLYLTSNSDALRSKEISM
jgi:hypothetical protein